MKTLFALTIFLSFAVSALADGMITTIDPNKGLTGEIQSYIITDYGPNQSDILDTQTGQQWHVSKTPGLDDWTRGDRQNHDDECDY
jgi:hypothetical protein